MSGDLPVVAELRVLPTPEQSAAPPGTARTEAGLLIQFYRE
jgi:hypothetical protein